MQLHARRQLRAQLLLDLFLDLINDGNCIGIGHLDDTQTHRRFTIEASELTVIGQAINHFSHILKTNRRTAFPADHHLLESINGVKFQIKLDQAFGFFTHHKTTGHLHMLFGKGLVDVLRSNRQRRHPCGQQFNADSSVSSATQANLTHPIDRLQPLLQHVDRVLVQLLLCSIPLNGQPDNRLGIGFHFGDNGWINILGQTAQDLIDLGLNLVESDINPLFQIEGNGNHRNAGRRGRLNMFDTGR